MRKSGSKFYSFDIFRRNMRTMRLGNFRDAKTDFMRKISNGKMSIVIIDIQNRISS